MCEKLFDAILHYKVRKVIVCKMKHDFTFYAGREDSGLALSV